MTEMQKSSMDFAGFQSEERALEAVRIRIDYQSFRYQHFMQPKGDDWLFSFALMEGQPDSGEIRTTTHLDPYAVRAGFFAVENEKAAVRFLSEAGGFWIWDRVTWSQFREWQEFLGWLRLDREIAMRNPEGTKAWLTAAGGFENHFFKSTDREFTRARFHGAELPPEDFRRNERDDRRRLVGLRSFALNLGQIGIDNRVTLNWYSPEGGFPPEDSKSQIKAARAERSAERSPFLRVEARYILEAIAATIYVDRAHGLRHGKCKHCKKIFEIKSDHGQQFCPAPDWLKSSPCKNAYLQKERREAEKLEREAERTVLKLRNGKAKKTREA